MKLKVLGSGSAGNCYLLQNEKDTLMLECGLPYKTILRGLKFNLINIVGCLVSHEHKDHSKSVREMMENGVDIYISKGTWKCFGYISHRLHFLKSEYQFEIGNFTVLPFETEHDAAEPLGFLIQHEDMGKLLFITDSYYCRYKFSGLNHIMIECNYSSDILQENIQKGSMYPMLAGRLLKSHFSFENVKEFLKETDLSSVREITLLHLSDGNSNAERFKEEIERLTGVPTHVADRDLEIELF
jgi:Metal-dependent hydrolases of the beta-lactamase superfamily I